MLLIPASGVAGQWDPLVDKLAADGFRRQWLEQLFDRPEVRFDPSIMSVKMKTLYKTKFGDTSVRKLQQRLAALGYQPGRADGKRGSKTRRAIRWFQAAHGLPVDGKFTEQLLQMAINERKRAPKHIRIPPSKAGPLVYRTIMTEERLAEAKKFLSANRRTLLRLERYYGIPGEIAVGILTVETRLGTYLGEKSAFLTLASMALCDDFKCVAGAFKDEHVTQKKRRWINRRTAQKAKWAYGECKALLTYTQRSDQDPLALPGSFYGAIGIAQFMPSQVLRHGVDGNGDGVVDLFVKEDALFSMGNYLMANGWRGSMRSRRKQRRAIYNYNHSRIYVNTVMAVADYLEEGETGQ
jgi:membrane-bound lytic murein transglycosylase B